MDKSLLNSFCYVWTSRESPIILQSVSVNEAVEGNKQEPLMYWQVPYGWLMEPQRKKNVNRVFVCCKSNGTKGKV